MIHVVVEDLAGVRADAVVRPATARLDALDRVGRRLDVAGGEAFEAQRTTAFALEVGAAVVTGAGALEAGLVIHAVLASDDEPVTPTAVRRALRSALQRAEQWELGHVALPPLGIGAGQLSFDEAARVTVEVLRLHASAARYPATVSLVVETDEQRAAVEQMLGRPAP